MFLSLCLSRHLHASTHIYFPTANNAQRPQLGWKTRRAVWSIYQLCATLMTLQSPHSPPRLLSVSRIIYCPVWSSFCYAFASMAAPASGITYIETARGSNRFVATAGDQQVFTPPHPHPVCLSDRRPCAEWFAFLGQQQGTCTALSN